MPNNYTWIFIIFCVTFLAIYVFYLYLKDKDKRKLMFSIAFFLLIPSYIGLVLGYIDLEFESTSVLWINIFTLTSFPLLYAVVIAANEFFLNIKDYNKYFNIFLVISLISFILVFSPYNFLNSAIPTIIRQVISLEIIIAVIYLFYKSREIENLYFLLYIICTALSALSFHLEYGYLSTFSALIGYVFLMFIFINKDSNENKNSCKIKSYFSIEKKLHSLEKKYIDLFNTIPDGICLLSTDGKIIDMNNSMANNFGVEKKDLIGKNMHDLLPKDIDKKRTDISIKSLRTGKIMENEDKRGDMYFHNMFIPIETGYEKELMIIARDITKEKKMEIERKEKICDLRKTELATLNIMEDMQETVKNLESARKEILDKNEELKMINAELNVAREQLTDLNLNLEKKVEERTNEVSKLVDQKDQFISQLGHDLKTPLTPLNTLLPIVYDKVNDEKLKDILEISIKNVNYMKNLVIKTLKLARLNSPSVQLELEKTNLLEEINTIIDKKNLYFKEHKITIQNKIKKDIIIDVDKMRIEELLENIISNAVKYSKEDGGNIIIDAEEKHDSIQLSIKDDGQGMKKDQTENIFDEFYKVDESRHDFESTGLGLSICKRIIEHHGGRIWAESNGIGKGSTFYLSFRKSNRKKIKLNT